MTPSLGIRGSEFDAVDTAADPSRLVAFLDSVRTHRQDDSPADSPALAMLDARAGESILDVGCGAGHDVIALTRLVGPTGRAIGVDSSVLMIQEARRRASGTRAEFQVADGGGLPFPNDTFDACRCERVLMHTPDPALVLREMIRVTSPGGRIVACEPDWETLVVDTPTPSHVTAAIRRQRLREGHHPAIGRQLRRLFLDQHMQNVTTAGYVAQLTDHHAALRILSLDRLAARGAIRPHHPDRARPMARGARRRRRPRPIHGRHHLFVARGEGIG